jgi:hypothetical protein
LLPAAGWNQKRAGNGLDLPYWMGLWFGTFLTWRVILAQIVSAVLWSVAITRSDIKEAHMPGTPRRRK